MCLGMVLLPCMSLPSQYFSALVDLYCMSICVGAQEMTCLISQQEGRRGKVKGLLARSRTLPERKSNMMESSKKMLRHGSEVGATTKKKHHFSSVESPKGSQAEGKLRDSVHHIIDIIWKCRLYRCHNAELF